MTLVEYGQKAYDYELIDEEYLYAMTFPNESENRVPLRVAAVYLAISTLWIIFSDRAVILLAGDSAASWQTAKGILFVGVTTLLIFELVRRPMKRLSQANRRLMQTREQLRLAFDSIQEGIVSTDSRGAIVSVNNALVTLIGANGKADLWNRPAKELLAEADRPGLERQMALALKDGSAPSISEYSINIDGGRTAAVELSVAAIRSEIPLEQGHIMVLRDVTERKRMQEKLLVADRLASVGELAAGIAHEINNPLTGIIGFSEMLLQEELPENHRRDVQTIHEEAQRAAGIVQSLLGISRKHKPDVRPVAVREVIDKVLALRQYEHRGNNIVTKIDSDDSLMVVADYFQLEQVFLNMVINAEFFMSKENGGGQLTIKTERVGRMVNISFSDTGPGIPLEIQDHVFDPFFTTKPEGKGTGLGLTICHGIIEQYGGRIGVSSQPGEGATFVIELPQPTD
ncbi:ATP-binding protein [Dehalogenimonas sp. THU2]|uniref:two-component system sensor histidine kinase NtrB n=1 Tax=Dehalogenimonas sp. THU2 TaxID=3151121 RepID=UPI0032187A8A